MKLEQKKENAGLIVFVFETVFETVIVWVYLVAARVFALHLQLFVLLCAATLSFGVAVSWMLLQSLLLCACVCSYSRLCLQRNR